MSGWMAVEVAVIASGLTATLAIGLGQWLARGWDDDEDE